jgi:hypothetical protein
MAIDNIIVDIIIHITINTSPVVTEIESNKAVNAK